MDLTSMLCEMYGVTIGDNKVEIIIKTENDGETVINHYNCILIGGSMVLKDDKGEVKVASFISGEFNEVLAERLFKGLSRAQEETAEGVVRRLSSNMNLPLVLRQLYNDMLEDEDMN